MSGTPEKSLTRRELAARAAARPPTEPQLLTGLLALEQLAVAVYDLVLASGTASPAERALLATLRGQESAHAVAVGRLLGVPPPSPPAGAGPIQAGLTRAGITSQLSAMRTAHDWFTLLETLESTLEGAYYAALADLTRPRTVALAAAILASEAQHSTLLFHERHPLDVDLAVAFGLVHGTAPPQPGAPVRRG